MRVHALLYVNSIQGDANAVWQLSVNPALLANGNSRYDF